jgi:serine/threonine protein kinase/outer membrane protein assembly factor BamB
MLPLGADDPRVIGEFRLHFRLGQGGMGRVYLASSPGGRAVAVKVVHARLARDPAFLGRFQREVAAAQAVNGAYAAPVVAAGPHDDPPWLATAYVAGPPLHEAVTETGPLPEDAVLKLAAGLAEALRAIHDAGVVHRDLKPANVLLADDGPRVIDFGIARAGDGTVLTSAGSVLGTPAFMSPEQAQGQPAGPASDVFSLGGVVYFAATGTSPFGSGNPAVMVYRIVHTEPDLDRLPPRVRQLVAACLAKNPAMRPAPVQLARSLADLPLPGDSQPAFWPTPVARLIADHQARFASGLMAGAPPSAEDVTIWAAPVATPSPPDQATPWAPAQPPTPPRWGEPATPPMRAEPATPALRAEPATPPLPAAQAASAGDGTARPVKPQPVPGMARRRALAFLGGMVTAGAVVAGWELSRPAPAVAANVAAQRRISSLPPGTRVWSFEANGKADPIVVSGGVAYVGTLDRATYALNALTGKLLWRHLMTPATAKTQFLVQATGVLVAANGYTGVAPTGYQGGAYGLDPGTGKLLWSTQAPVVNGLFAAGDVVYAGTAVKDDVTGGVTALTAATGEVLWTFDFPTNVDLNGGVTVSGGVVYANSSHGEIFALSAANGNMLWRFAEPSATFNNGILVTDGVLYSCSAHNKTDNAGPVLYALHAGTGRVLWQQPMGATPYGDSAGLANGDGVLFTIVLREPATSSSPGLGVLSAFNAATGQQLWQVQVAGGASSIAENPGNEVYTGNDHGVIDAWQANTGNHLWSYRAPAPFASVLTVNDGVAYFGCTDNRVYAVTVQR